MSQIVETRQLLDVHRMASAILVSSDTGAIGQIIGEPGTGKSVAGKWLAKKLDAARVCCSHSISTNALLRKAYTAFSREAPPASNLMERLEVLAAGKLLIVDEANHLRWQQLEALRYLADEAGTGLLLIGTDLLDRPFRDSRTNILLAQLASRIGGKRIRFSHFTDMDEIVVHVLQPRFGSVSKTVAQMFFRKSGGFWRDAAELANACERMMQANGKEALTAEIVKVAAEWMAPARQPTGETAS
ncbi:AAA family ATPase [Burkholderia sp. LMG 21824]|uniref:AAA family ATPase n=1 Tax=Burkholderia sp. LMG 21824 TaxID=3158172 RepID=UPI003C2E8ED1